MKHSSLRFLVFIPVIFSFSIECSRYNTWRKWATDNYAEEKKIIFLGKDFFKIEQENECAEALLLQAAVQISSIPITCGSPLMSHLDSVSSTSQVVYAPKSKRITFDNVYGEIPEIAHDIIHFLKEPHRAPCENAIIFSGTTGTGKSLLAEAIAGEADAKFIKCSGSEFMEQYVGLGARRVRDLFDIARKSAQQGTPVVVLIDEIDGLIKQRKNDDSNMEGDLTVNQFLTSIDTHLDKNLPIVIIGTTNREDCCDMAAKRPGRLRVHQFKIPDTSSRQKIVQSYLQDTFVLPQNVLDTFATHLAKNSAEYTVAELKEVIHVAHKISYRATRNVIKEDFDAAFQEVNVLKNKRLKLEKKDKKKNEEEGWGNTISQGFQITANILHIVVSIITIWEKTHPQPPANPNTGSGTNSTESNNAGQSTAIAI